MLNVPFFTLLLDLLTYAKQTNHQETKQQRKKQKDWKCHQLGLYSWTKGGLGKHNKRTDKRGEVENGFRQWETLNQWLFHVSPTDTYSNTCIQSCTHGSQRQRQHSRVSLWLWDGEKENEKERERKRKSSCWLGVDRATPVPHRQITLERTHHLCSFVELSHFNPWPGPFGNQLHNPPPSAEPPPHQSFSPAAVSTSTSVLPKSGVRYTPTNTLLPKPPQQLVCLMSVKNTRWGGEDGDSTLWRSVGSVCLTFLLLFKREKKMKKERNLLFKIFIFEGWLCWRSKSRDLVAVLY